MNGFLSYEGTPHYGALPVAHRLELQDAVNGPGSGDFRRLFTRPGYVQRQTYHRSEGVPKPVPLSTRELDRARADAVRVLDDEHLALYRRLTLEALRRQRWNELPEADRDAVEREVNDLTNARHAALVALVALEELSHSEEVPVLLATKARFDAVTEARGILDERVDQVTAWLDELGDLRAPLPRWAPLLPATPVGLTEVVDDALATIERSTGTYRAINAYRRGQTPK